MGFKFSYPDFGFFWLVISHCKLEMPWNNFVHNCDLFSKILFYVGHYVFKAEGEMGSRWNCRLGESNLSTVEPFCSFSCWAPYFSSRCLYPQFLFQTNGNSNGLVPMLRVYNNTARYVDQGGNKVCFVTESPRNQNWKSFLIYAYNKMAHCVCF